MSLTDPDTKDWTWVLGRTCPECGFDASTCDPMAVPSLVRANATDWQMLLAEGRIARVAGTLRSGPHSNTRVMFATSTGSITRGSP